MCFSFSPARALYLPSTPRASRVYTVNFTMHGFLLGFLFRFAIGIAMELFHTLRFWATCWADRPVVALLR